jgi:predicted nucleotide-binding protein (sugar kinase/HSP70/actin superfamily)
MVDYEAKRCFMHFYTPAPQPEAGSPIKDIQVKKGIFGQRRVEYTRPFNRSPAEAQEKRRRTRIGIPRVLNLYSTAPFFRTYFEAVGIPKQNVVFSDETTEEMWVEGGKYGSIDPCYPSKVAQAHIHHLIFHAHTAKKPLKYIFFPILTHVQNFVTDTMDNASCPIVAGAPDVMKAAFTKEVDFFATRGIEFLDPALSFEEPNLTAKRLFETFGERLGITRDENDHACREGWKALTIFENDLQEKGRAILETVEHEDKVAILLTGRPYHSDPGLNHGIPDEFQVLGYPILSIRSIPRSREYLDKYFQEDLDAGKMKSPLELNHVWPENYTENSAQKVWGAIFAAHHPNVVVLDLSSFKCGHDAPIYGLIDSIIEKSKTPYAALHDIDANKPSGSIKIRVKTYAHALKLHEERLQDAAMRKSELVHRIDQKRLELLELKTNQLSDRRVQDPQLLAQIESLREKIREYKPKTMHATAPVEQSKDVIKLGKKNKDGSISRVSETVPTANAATVSATSAAE